MTNMDYLIFKTITNRIVYYQEKNFDKYVILDYMDGMINSIRKGELYSDELLRHLFDIRQKVLLGKEVKIGG